MMGFLLLLVLPTHSLASTAVCAPIGQFSYPGDVQKDRVIFNTPPKAQALKEAAFNTKKCPALNKRAQAILQERAAAGQRIFAILRDGCLTDVQVPEDVLKFHPTFSKDACAKSQLIKYMVGRQSVYVGMNESKWIELEAREQRKKAKSTGAL